MMQPSYISEGIGRQGVTLERKVDVYEVSKGEKSTSCYTPLQEKGSKGHLRASEVVPLRLSQCQPKQRLQRSSALSGAFLCA